MASAKDTTASEFPLTVLTFPVTEYEFCLWHAVASIYTHVDRTVDSHELIYL